MNKPPNLQHLTGSPLRVHVLHDEAAGCYVATSPDLAGLVVEARSLDALAQEVDECIGMLLRDQCLPFKLLRA